jgi:hypothetical protein
MLTKTSPEKLRAYLTRILIVVALSVRILLYWNQYIKLKQKVTVVLTLDKTVRKVLPRKRRANLSF